jgi:hypothetical protein
MTLFVYAGISNALLAFVDAGLSGQRTTHSAIAARADYEHSAMMRGDNWRGTFGRYQPAPLVAGLTLVWLGQVRRRSTRTQNTEITDLTSAGSKRSATPHDFAQIGK